MTAAKDVRPNSSHRPPSSLASSLGRQHSHSLSLGSLNPAHRVSRRKSSSSLAGVNMAALAAVAAKDAVNELPASSYKGKSSVGGYNGGGAAMLASPAPTAPDGDKGSALVDGPSLSTMLVSEKAGSNKSRVRRASEGSRLAATTTTTRGERSRSNAGDLRCDKCGKGYKHGSCLTKHLWEHTPEWSLTSKLLISKHQQVQLLEAASVLVNMNNDPTLSESMALVESDMSSASPAASGSSDMREDDDMSSRTSTPSYDDTGVSSKATNFSRPRRQDSYGTAFSRSYQSTSGASAFASSYSDEASTFNGHWNTSNDHVHMHHSNRYEEDQADLAAAAEGLLSCSLGTPKNGPVYMPDVPPVPPLPAKFARQHEQSYGASPTYAPLSYHRSTLSAQANDFVQQSDMNHALRGRSEDEDDGVFGKMEQ